MKWETTRNDENIRNAGRAAAHNIVEGREGPDDLPAPLALIELSVCACKSDCSTNRCKCRKKQLCLHGHV